MSFRDPFPRMNEPPWARGWVTRPPIPPLQQDSADAPNPADPDTTDTPDAADCSDSSDPDTRWAMSL